MTSPSAPSARVLAALLALGAALLCYRAGFLIGTGAAARYHGWLRALTWAELALAATIACVALAWLATGAASACRWTLRLTAAIVLVHAFRVAVFVLARTGPWVDFDMRPDHRPLDPASWTWGGVRIAAGLTALSLVVLAAVLVWRRVWRRRMTSIHK